MNKIKINLSKKLLIVCCICSIFIITNSGIAHAEKAPYGDWDFGFQGPIEVNKLTLDNIESLITTELKIEYKGTEKKGTVMVKMDVVKEGYGKFAEQNIILSDMRYNEMNPHVKEIRMEQPIISSGEYSVNVTLNSPNENVRWVFENYTKNLEFNVGEIIIEPRIKDETDKKTLFVDPMGSIDTESVVVVSGENILYESYDWIVFKNNGIVIKIIEAKPFHLVFDSDLNIGYHNFTIELYKKGNIPNEYFSAPLAFAMIDIQNPTLNGKPEISTWDSDTVCQKGITCNSIDTAYYWIITIGIISLIMALIVGFYIRQKIKIYKRFTVIGEGIEPEDTGMERKYLKIAAIRLKMDKKEEGI